MSILFKIGAWVLGMIEVMGRWGRRSKKPLDVV
jgi:hypothetical protein